MNKYYLVFALIIFSILQGFSQVNNNGIIKGVIIDTLKTRSCVMDVILTIIVRKLIRINFIYSCKGRENTNFI